MDRCLSKPCGQQLLSGQLLAQLMRTKHHALESEVQLDMSTCYTDLQIALCWIKEEEIERKQFVENCVSEVRRLIPAKHWKNCAGTENPADIPSRGSRTPGEGQILQTYPPEVAELQEKVKFCIVVWSMLACQW